MRHGTCIHFTGFGLLGDEACCKAGVVYAQAFDAKTPGMALRMPCVDHQVRPAKRPGTLVKPGEPYIRVEIDRRGQAVVPCSRRIEPTDEQVAQAMAEDEAQLERAITAIRVAAAWRVRPKPAENRHEVVLCPVCKGRLHLTQFAINGHVHGQCETPKCVAFME